MPERDEHIAVYNRYTGSLETESVYGEKWLRWSYETAAGRLMLNAVIKRAWFSRWYGWRMSRPGSRRLVQPFVETYGLDETEFADPVTSFRSFNDFFSRELRSGARPIDPDPASIVFPADGRHLGFPSIGSQDRIYAKGQSLNLHELFDDSELARRFAGGAVVISRLCPVDYHRFHMPCAGVLSEPRSIPGPLFSVSPIALRSQVGFLAENKRAVSLIRETVCGTVAMVEVGATCVGTIIQTAPPGWVAKGVEKGMFRFGGSCVITLFEPKRVKLSDDLATESARGYEIFARMGDRLGMAQVV